MNATKIVLRGLGGLGLALTQFGIAVVLTTVQAVAEGIVEIDKELARQRQAERLRRQEEALSRVVLRTQKAAPAATRVVLKPMVVLCQECRLPLDIATAKIATCHFMCPNVERAVKPLALNHRLGCLPWCGHSYQESGTPVLMMAPNDAKPPYPSYFAWTEDHRPGTVWCHPRCRESKLPPNPTTVPGAAAGS